MITAVWRFASSVTRNTQATADNTSQITRLAEAIEVQHSKLSRRLRKLEKTKQAEHVLLADRIARLERGEDARKSG